MHLSGRKAYNSSFKHDITDHVSTPGIANSPTITKEVTNLFGGTVYTIRVAGVTGGGQGENSSPEAANTDFARKCCT